MLNILALVVMLAALALLAASLVTARRLLVQLPAGPMLVRWRVLSALIPVFMAGYAGYMFGWSQRHADYPDMLVPLLFLANSGFIWLTAQVSLATVVNVRHLSSLDRAQVTDVLTGLRSRHFLDAQMKQELGRVKRHGLAVSAMLLDIDHFADVNRDYGHAVGDQVLTEIGRILSASVRESDLLVRYGGEEIAMLATHTPPAAAMAVAERLRREVEAGARKALRDAQGVRRAITVSIGVAGHDAGFKGAIDLFELAGQALQMAKREGRNRVALAQA